MHKGQLHERYYYNLLYACSNTRCIDVDKAFMLRHTLLILECKHQKIWVNQFLEKVKKRKIAGVAGEAVHVATCTTEVATQATGNSVNEDVPCAAEDKPEKAFVMVEAQQVML